MDQLPPVLPGILLPLIWRFFVMVPSTNARCSGILEELHHPDFVAHVKMLTAWGKPGDRPVFTARKI